MSVKTLIWLLCITISSFLFGLIQTILSYANISLGGILTGVLATVLYALAIWIASKLCKKYEQKKAFKKNTTVDSPPSEQHLMEMNNQCFSETKTKKVRYCSKCGGLIDAESKKCTQCAKQYFKWTASKIIILVLSLLLVISLVINFMQFDENLSLNSSRNYWRNEADEWKTTATNLVDAGVEDYKFIRFYSTYAAIVIEDTKIYHVYGCENLDVSAPFYIYNIPTAKSKGYYPCPKCHD